MKASHWRHVPLFLWLALVPLPGLAGTGLQVHDAWIAEGPPGMDMLAGYLDVENTGDTALRINGISSDAAAQIEIHRTKLHDGVASMVPIPVLTLPAHARLHFKQGGYHLMLMGLRAPLQAGDNVDLVIKLGDGSSVMTHARVRRDDDGSM